MIHLQFPEFLVLAVPLAFACWRWGGFRPAWNWLFPIAAWAAAATWLFHVPWWAHLWLIVPIGLWLRPWIQRAGMTGLLRLGVLTLLLLALTGPEWDLGGNGIDIVVVADRSRSMPVGAEASIHELIENLENNRRGGDRIGVVTFGQSGLMEHDLSETVQSADEFIQPVGSDGSNLNHGLLTALDLINPNRPARILVLSDGESNGESPTFAARRARELGVPIDYRLFEVVRTGDVAIRELSLPEQVGPLEPFQFTVGVHADKATAGELTVLRDGKPFVTRLVDLIPGANRIAFRDVVAEGGLRNYEAQLRVEGDPLSDNNRGEGIVRVEAGPRLLVLNEDGQPGNLVRALKAADLPVDVQVASEHPLTQDSLDGYRGVIIENVPAGLFGRLKMERLAQFVGDLGGGLLLTGGQRSFGTGGYYQSPLDDVLPVSMEMREEHRKTRIAIAVALDRSGSMSMPVGGGMTKMDLANLGTAEVVKLLTPGDSVAVIAVDSAPHVIQPLTPIDNPASIVNRIKTIQSMGGGIFVYEALVAAGNEVTKATQATKHIILFSDANDSEEPGSYESLLKKYEAAGITVSVIGLGTKGDVDAALLEDIAKRGNGNILFTQDPQELPRLFTQDTMSVARSTFVEKDSATQPNGIGGALIPNARLMGDLQSLVQGTSFPSVDGYNLSYLKPNATVAVQSTDEYTAPWSAFWYHGLGRAAAITVEVDGKFSGQFGRWDKYEDFLITHARWLMSLEAPPDIYVDLTRAGQDAVLTLELDPQRPDKASGVMPQVVVVPPGAERLDRITPDLTWTGPDTLEARFTLTSIGSYRTIVKTPSRSPNGRDRILRGPAVALPYSPEFDPRDTLPAGKEVLAEVAELSGGVQRTDVLELLRDPPRSAKSRSMLPWLFGSVIALLLLEIAGRRLSLWERLEELAIARPSTTTPKTLATSPPAANWWTRLRAVAKNRRSAPAGPRTASKTDPVATTDGEKPTGAASPAAPAPTSPASTTKDVFAAAKNRAKKRLQ
ncbi:MAG: VWA domain-containing protein [Planctomycetaceae bacterium]